MTTPNPTGQIYDWFAKAVPEPEQKNLNVQLGVHFEEISEMLQTLINVNPIGIPYTRLSTAYAGVLALAESLKNGDIDIPQNFDDTTMLDSICDQIVTAIGVGYMYDYDVVGALGHVADSNDSKFVDGEPVFKPNGKIAKGPNYWEPVLGSFV